MRAQIFALLAGTNTLPRTPSWDNGEMSADLEFENLVKLYYGDLYRFGLSLTGSETDAADLTQETFYIWANKGHQLQKAASVKGWLFTTLHREFKTCAAEIAFHTNQSTNTWRICRA